MSNEDRALPIESQRPVADSPRAQLEATIRRTLHWPVSTPLGATQADARKHARAIVAVHAAFVAVGLVPAMQYDAPHAGLVARGWRPSQFRRGYFGRPGKVIAGRASSLDAVGAVRAAMISDVRAVLRARGWSACPTASGVPRALAACASGALATAAAIELELLERSEGGVRA